MKRKLLLTLLIATITCTLSQAQIKKGSIFLGGQIGFFISKGTNETPDYTSRSTSFSISPAYGKAIKDNLIAGVDLLFGINKTDLSSITPDILNSHSYGAGFFMRKYMPLGKGFYLFGQGRIGGAYIKQNMAPGNPNDFYNIKSWNVTAGFYPGISFALNNKLHIETGFNGLVGITFEHSDIKTNIPGYPASRKENSFGISSSLNNLSNVSLGLRLLLSKT